MKRGLGLVSVLIAGMLAGCLAPPGAADTPAGGAPGDVMELILIADEWPGMREAGVLSYVDLDQVQAALPPGFVAAEVERPGSAVTGDARPKGLVAIVSIESPASTIANGSFTWGLVGALIETPEIKGVDLPPLRHGVDSYYFGIYTSADRMVELLAPLGYAAVPGAATVPDTANGEGVLGSGSAEDAEGPVWSFDLAATASGYTNEGDARGWTASERGIFVWDWTYQDREYRDDVTRLTCQIREGTLAAHLVGTDCGIESDAFALVTAEINATIRFFPKGEAR